MKTKINRSKMCIDKLERMNKALNHQEPDRVPISDFFWGSFIERWKKELNIHTKLLVNSSPIEKKKEKFYKDNQWLKTGYLPVKNKVDQFVMYIIGDVVSIMSMENNNLVGIKITNQHLAKNFKNIFDILWQKSNQIK